MTTSEQPNPPVDPSLVLIKRRSPHIEWVQIQGESVVWNAEEDTLHRLDSMATLVFQLCDGSATLRVTVSDLAGAFGRTADTLEEDVLDCAGRLLASRLVEVRS